ncbi:MAG TPA: hypothetical protein VGI43_09760 [Mucilaginibacter sp.]
MNKPCQPKCFFATEGLCTQAGKTAGLQSFCRATLSLYYHARKKLLCPRPLHRPAVFSALPEAVLLTEEASSYTGLILLANLKLQERI